MFSVLYIPMLTYCLKINVFGLLKISLRLFMWRLEPSVQIHWQRNGQYRIRNGKFKAKRYKVRALFLDVALPKDCRKKRYDQWAFRHGHRTFPVECPAKEQQMSGLC